MVRSVNGKYNLWIAGYYDDFGGARAIAEDNNSPSATGSYDHTKTHYGNPMNGEATLNPKYRWSIIERSLVTNYDSTLVGTNNTTRYLQNNGSFEYIGQDVIRNKSDKWEGKAQLQYPDGNVGNKYRYGGSGSDAYQLFTNGYDTLGKYIIPLGASDSTFGRTNSIGYGDGNFTSKNAGYVDATYTVAFTQKANLIGTWMGETMRFDNASHICPENVFFPVTSPASKPFLAIQSYYQTAPNSGVVPSTASIIYDGSLNSRADGDIFHLRVAVRSFNGSTTSEGNAGANVNVMLGFTSRVGDTYEDGFTHSSNTPAISFNLSLNNYDSYGALYNGNATKTTYTNDTAWIDVDVTLDYTNGAYVVYQDGAQVSSGSFTGTAANMYGYQITAYPDDNKDNSVITLMLDRVALYRPLTNHPSGIQLAPVNDLKITSVVNGISSCKLSISDDADNDDGDIGFSANDYDYTLTPIFDSSITSDWYLLVFGASGYDWDVSSRIDRPLWRGIIEKMRIKQQGRDRIVELQARDNLSLLDRQVPLWEVGQDGLNDDESQNPFWLYDSQGFSNTMNFGVKPLKLLSKELGFDSDDAFLERTDQRMQLGSGHPIQMYVNEDADGPNDVEDDYAGVGINSVGKNGNKTIIFLSGNASYTTSSSITIRGGAKNGMNITAQTPSAVGTHIDRDGQTQQTLSFTQTQLPYQGSSIVGGNAKGNIVYAGKFDWSDETDYDYWYNKITYNGQFIIRSPNTFPTFPDEMNQSDRIAGYSAVNLALAELDQYIIVNAFHPSSEQYSFCFDEDPNLKPYDFFRVPVNSNPNGTVNNVLSDKVHYVMSIRKVMNQHVLNNNDIHTELQTGSRQRWIVTTNTSYFQSGSGTGVEFGNFTTYDGLLSGDDRLFYESSVSIGTPISTSLPTNQPDLTSKVSQAVWMRDLPKSLWFQYHFGDITTNTHIADTTTAAIVSSNATTVQISSTTKTALDNANVSSGVAELNGSDLFIFKGVVTVGSNHYLVGCQFISRTHSNGVALKFPQIRNDYKHLWLLWSDMRNNGRASADSGTRKRNFGLQSPSSSNYEINIFFKDQVNNQNQKDLFTTLKTGEDVDIWSVDSTLDPTTGSAFSRPIDYSNPIPVNTITAVTGNANASLNGKTLVTYPSAHNLTATTYHVALYNTNSHDGAYEILNVPSTTTLILDKVFGSADSGKTGGILSAKTTGTTLLFDKPHYKEWHNLGGAFLIIDSSKFFNINSNANNGRVGQAAGGKTTLSDYTATVRGFPDLIDNYWSEAISTSANSGSLYSEHPNKHLIRNDLVLTTNNSKVGDFFLCIDTDDFDNSGYGRIVGVKNDGNNSQTKTEVFFGWQGKNGNDRTGTVTGYGNNPSAGYFELTDSNATFQTWGIEKGMYIINTTTDKTIEDIYSFSSNGGRFRILSVESQTVIRVELTYYSTQLIQSSPFIGLGSGRVPSIPLTSDMTSNRWGVNNSYLIPEQLSGVATIAKGAFMIDADSTQDEIREEVERLYETICGVDTIQQRYIMMDFIVNETFLYNNGTFSIEDKLAAANLELGFKTKYDAVSITNTLAPIHLMDLMMYVDGFVECRTSNTYFDHDKFRALWTAATMKTWLPQTRLSTTYDINNIPITENISTDGGTSHPFANIDSYGGPYDSRTQDLLKIVRNIQKRSGQGIDKSLVTSFSFLQGRDGKIEYRPKYNSGHNFTRNNLSISDLDGDIAGKIDNVRVYYKNGYSFVDFPKPELTDTTRWKVIEHPDITSDLEALSIAKKEYNTQKNPRLSIKASPMKASEQFNGSSRVVADTMLDGGRFGYIADPQRVIQGYDDLTQADAYSWTRLGTGGTLFGGMVNGMDGMMDDASDIYNRFGNSNNASGWPITWNNNYYWYGSNSLSYALQIVHIPKYMPKVNSNGEPLRLAISVNTNLTSSIDDAVFTLHLLDYQFSASQNSEGHGPSLAATTVSNTGTSLQEINMKGSGFYEINVPSSYWASTGQASGIKVVISFNAEYCKALLRHRCGSRESGNLFKNANSITGTTITTGNSSSIFPLGMRKYTEMKGYANTRAEWYAPRLLITDDLVYLPATFATYTDKGLGLTNEVLSIQKVDWRVSSDGLETINLRLERDESLAAAGVLPYIFSGMGTPTLDTQAVSVADSDEGNNTGVGGGTFTPPGGVSGADNIDPNKDNPEGGNAYSNEQGGTHFKKTIGIQELTTTLYSTLKGRGNLSDSTLSYNNKFTILGQQKPSKRPSAMKATEGLGQTITPSTGSLTVTNKGISFGGAGHPEDNAQPNTTTSFFMKSPTDVMTNEINITAKVSMKYQEQTKIAILLVKAECLETGSFTNNSVVVRTNTENTIQLLSTDIEGIKKAGNTMKITISRSAGQNADTASTMSVNVSDIQVNYRRAAVFSDSGSSTFTN